MYYRNNEVGNMKIAFSRINKLFPLWLYHLGRMVLAVIFLWSGLIKLSDPASFGIIIDAYGLMPENWIMPVAIGLSVMEIAAAAGLLIDARGSLATIAGLLVMFMALLAYGIHLGLDIDCGCFGPDDPESGAFHGLRTAFYRDIAMMAGVLYLYLCRINRFMKPIRLWDMVMRGRFRLRAPRRRGFN